MRPSTCDLWLTLTDDQFVVSFFMTYRRFCQPVDLMTEFLDRFVEVEQYAVSRDIRLWALMK